MKRMLFLLPLILALVLLVPTAAAAEAACEGCTLGTWEGLPACLKGGQLHVCANNFPDENFRAYIEEKKNPNHDLVLTEEECKIDFVSVFSENISTLEGIGFFPSLTYIACIDNHLGVLDLRNNPNLESLYINNNRLNRIIGYLPNLATLDCSNNSIGTLDLSQFPNLIYLVCRNTLLTTLNISHCPNLTELYCDNNSLKKLDLLQNQNLKNVSCMDQSINIYVSSTATSLQCDLLKFFGESVKTPLEIYCETGSYEIDPETYILTLHNTTTLRLVLPLPHSMNPVHMNSYTLEKYGCPYISLDIVFHHSHNYTCGERPDIAICILCGETAQNSYAGHNYKDNQTCMSPRTCARCGYQEPDSIVHHNWKDRGICLPRICTRCGIEDPDNPPLHRWYGTATCTKSRSCIECGAEEGILGPHRNRPETEIVLEPTWRETGLKVLRCARCDEIIEEITIPALWDTPEGRLRPMVTLARILDFSTFLAVIVVLAVVIIKDLLPRRKKKT